MRLTASVLAYHIPLRTSKCVSSVLRRTRLLLFRTPHSQRAQHRPTSLQNNTHPSALHGLFVPPLQGDTLSYKHRKKTLGVQLGGGAGCAFALLRIINVIAQCCLCGCVVMQPSLELCSRCVSLLQRRGDRGCRLLLARHAPASTGVRRRTVENLHN